MELKKGSQLYSLFNTFNLKVSYSTGPNMKDIIARHNAKVMRRSEEGGRAAPPGCNCQGGAQNCPLNGQCLIQSLVYRADVRVGANVKHYIGQTSNTFKTRWNGHKSDTRCGRSRTGLNSYLIELKSRGEFPDSITWSKVAGSLPRKRGGKICSLCNDEKVFIAINHNEDSLNDRSEMMSRCRHRDRLMLSNCYKERRTVHIPDPVTEVDEQPDSTEEPEAVTAVVPASTEGCTGSSEVEEPCSSRGRRRAEVSYKRFY